jgi:hypothetical protein
MINECFLSCTLYGDFNLLSIMCVFQGEVSIPGTIG